MYLTVLHPFVEINATSSNEVAKKAYCDVHFHELPFHDGASTAKENMLSTLLALPAVHKARWPCHW